MKTIAFKIDDETHKKIKVLALKNDLTVTELMTKLCSQVLSSNENKDD